ncbi:hypothetical protein MMC21_004152 [Puttea exsequens]|nr:hypothetical protein [Puttea exsequens]
MTKDFDGWSALGRAILGGKNDTAEVLLTTSSDAENDGGYKALYLAAGEGHEETVYMLLARGVNVNGRDWLGSKALDWATPAGHEMSVRLFLRYGADLGLRDMYENTALHWAIQYEAIIRLLLEHGADVNAKNNCE